MLVKQAAARCITACWRYVLDTRCAAGSARDLPHVTHHDPVLVRQLVVHHPEVGAANVQRIAAATLLPAGGWQGGDTKQRRVGIGPSLHLTSSVGPKVPPSKSP
jgi:hypothetical protein